MKIIKLLLMTHCLLLVGCVQKSEPKEGWLLKHAEQDGTEQWASQIDTKMSITLHPNGEAITVLFLSPEYFSTPEILLKPVAIGVTVMPNQTVIIATVRRGLYEGQVVLRELQIPYKIRRALDEFKSSHPSFQLLKKVKGKVRTTEK